MSTKLGNMAAGPPSMASAYPVRSLRNRSGDKTAEYEQIGSAVHRTVGPMNTTKKVSLASPEADDEGDISDIFVMDQFIFQT
ncbi:hypothetical protein [Sedimentitalea sp.]|uniref:hypothetical protein n=1 Tax=Sedimentitalea sp. TaxID=2048915 RepID=UPI00329824C1